MAWARQLRLHQWTKNFLLAIPALASFSIFDGSKPLLLTVAFFAFSFTASAVYIFNDVLDVESDREHSIKKSRPIAAGKISTTTGLIVGLIMIAAGVALAFQVNADFVLVLATYLFGSFVYAIWLKKVTLVDAITLAGLYTLRIIAGAVALGLELSFWLLAFSVFFFLSIAWVKRYAELEASSASGSKLAPGRGYLVTDMPLVLTFGSVSAFVSVMIFALYLDSDAIALQYSQPAVAWLAIPFLLYLISRLWFKAHRGRMNEDPILFIFRDAPSLIASALVATFLLLSHFGWLL